MRKLCAVLALLLSLSVSATTHASELTGYFDANGKYIGAIFGGAAAVEVGPGSWIITPNIYAGGFDTSNGELFVYTTANCTGTTYMSGGNTGYASVYVTAMALRQTPYYQPSVTLYYPTAPYTTPTIGSTQHNGTCSVGNPYGVTTAGVAASVALSFTAPFIIQ